MPTKILDHRFYSRRPQRVAIELLGKVLVSTIDGRRASGMIVETEAYLASGDSACHGANGQTRSNTTMFGPAGVAYVYPIHSRFCFNVVTQAAGLPSAVLIRAVQPIDGVALMMTRRQEELTHLCSGPAKLCQALGIDRQVDGLDLTRRRKMWIEQCESNSVSMGQIRKTARIGVTSAHSLQLRYVIRDSRFASGPKSMR